MSELQNILRNIPVEIKWEDVVQRERMDERISCVGMLSPNTIGVCEGYLEYCPDNNPPHLEENLSWIWVIRPDLVDDLLKLNLSEEFKKLLLCYQSDTMEEWWEFVI
jgi:hypothetical protein